MRFECAIANTTLEFVGEDNWSESMPSVELFIARMLTSWRTAQSKKDLKRLLLKQIYAKFAQIFDPLAEKEQINTRYTFSDGRKYEGQFNLGKFEGEGMLTWSGNNYSGSWLQGKRNGHGRY